MSWSPPDPLTTLTEPTPKSNLPGVPPDMGADLGNKDVTLYVSIFIARHNCGLGTRM